MSAIIYLSLFFRISRDDETRKVNKDTHFIHVLRFTFCDEMGGTGERNIISRAVTFVKFCSQVWIMLANHDKM